MSNSTRVIIRHVGPPGIGIPSGGFPGQVLTKDTEAPYRTRWANPASGSDAVEGPSGATADAIAVFNGSTGKKIKSSGIPLSSLATAEAVANKVDKVTGKQLSQENFTTTLKNKLNGLTASGYRGSFANLAAVNAFDFSPTPQAGDFCLIEETATDVKLVVWDNTNLNWVVFSLEPPVMTGEDIATALFNEDDSPTYNQADCRVFTDSEKAMLALHQQALEAFTGGTGLVAAHGQVTYFSLTGTAVAIASTSDGLTNMVKVNPVTALVSANQLFDTNSTTGRLRYTGVVTKTFRIAATLSVGDAINDTLVLGITKNGAVIEESRVLVCLKSAGQVGSVSLSVLVDLDNHDYVEVFCGNTDSTSDPTVFTLSLEAGSR